jgi:hypothetical protein
MGWTAGESGLIPGKVRYFPPNLQPRKQMVSSAISVGVEEQRLEAELSSASAAQNKNEWRCALIFS